MSCQQCGQQGTDGSDRHICQNVGGYGLYCFLPEILAQNAFHEATYGEQIVLHSGEQKYEMYIDQLASSRWIQESVTRGF